MAKINGDINDLNILYINIILMIEIIKIFQSDIYSFYEKSIILF